MFNASVLKLNQLSQGHTILKNTTQQLINDLESLGLLPSYPAASCAVILHFAPSLYQATIGSGPPMALLCVCTVT